MTKIQKYNGYWWLPSNSENKLPGSVEIDNNDNFILTLQGSFSKEKDHQKNIYKNIIFGNTNNGEVTLYHCYLRDSGWHTTGYSHSNFSIRYIFEGAHINNPNKKWVNGIHVVYPELFNWFNQRLIGITNKTINTDKKSTILLKNIIPGVNASFIFFIAQGGQYGSPTEITISERLVIELHFDVSHSFEEIEKIIAKLMNFFRFATGQNLIQEYLSIDLPKKTSIKLPSVEVITETKSKPIEHKAIFEMLFSYVDAQQNFDSILKNWLRQYDYFHFVYDLYFNAFFDKQVIEQSFLNTIYALEAYHRRTGNNYQLPKEEYKKRIDQILKVCPKEYQVWLQSKLSFSNEPSLAERINEIINKFNEIKLIFINDPKFVSTVVKIRNRLTHYDPKQTKKTTEPKILLKLLFKLRLLLESCILLELGFSIEKITQLIRKKYINQLHYWDLLEEK